jgi:hypothetical protein
MSSSVIPQHGFSVATVLAAVKDKLAKFERPVLEGKLLVGILVANDPAYDWDEYHTRRSLCRNGGRLHHRRLLYPRRFSDVRGKG